VGHEGRILAHAEQHRGLALAQEVDTAEEQARDLCAGTVVGEREAHGVEGRKPYPACVVGPEAGGEDHRPEAVEVQLRRPAGVEGRRVGQLRRRDPPAGELLAEQLPDVGVTGVTEGDRVSQVTGEGCPMSLHPGQAAQKLHPHRLQGAVVQVMAASLPTPSRTGAPKLDAYRCR
jgi:hypothetical protein